MIPQQWRDFRKTKQGYWIVPWLRLQTCHFKKVDSVASAFAAQPQSALGQNFPTFRDLLLRAYSARLLLHDESRYPSTRHRAIADPLTRINIEADIAAHMLRLADSVGGTRRCGVEEISPFCLEPMYRAGIMYGRRYTETGQHEDQQAFETIKQGLSAMSGRWKAAGKS